MPAPLASSWTKFHIPTEQDRQQVDPTLNLYKNFCVHLVRSRNLRHVQLDGNLTWVHNTVLKKNFYKLYIEFTSFK
jgi:hypothetical protein